MKTPVAFLIFNRPDTTKKVFESIRQAKPPKLLVVADGPRSDPPGEAEKCQAARAIIDRVDWKCEVLTNYSQVNLGCKLRVSSGLDWVFKNVEEAIILEDDCLPHPSFFRFCEELLDYYRDDERIIVISGDNFQFGHKRTEYSYYFSRYNHCWGWATWKRAWQYYDIDMKLWSKIRDGNWLKFILEEPRTVKYWSKIFQATYEDNINSWAFRWTFACWLQSGLTILPNVNLVSNIGFGREGTHTTDIKNPFANLPVEKMCFPLQHPPFIIRDVEADKFTQNTNFSQALAKRLINKTQRVLSKLVKA
ncbi:MAG: glycosyltransferase family A protein [Xenococcaceae cyanobacterium MO_188.B29]|nr:glycosyltransferase family A protein [Xenococcaceae cyanobacterium MO_188.B29]